VKTLERDAPERFENREPPWHRSAFLALGSASRLTASGDVSSRGKPGASIPVPSFTGNCGIL